MGEHSALELYEAAFLASQTRKVLQVGGLYDPPETDPARIVLRKHGLLGLVVAGTVPERQPESGWQQGPLLSAVDISVEGGSTLFAVLRPSGWADVDMIRLEDLPGGCLLLRGLFAAGLKAGMVVMIVNG